MCRHKNHEVFFGDDFSNSKKAQDSYVYSIEGIDHVSIFTHTCVYLCLSLNSVADKQAAPFH